MTLIMKSPAYGSSASSYKKSTNLEASPCEIDANGVPRGIRTPDLLVRSQTLYPAELWAHILNIGPYKN